jgi:deazaflavin-dependent oxidoreductase (nitroreductase family)
MVDQNERNALLAEEFRTNGGKVAEEKFENANLLLLTTTGRVSGRSYMNPVQYLRDADRFIVFGSHQGAAENPDWFKNLEAAGTATVEVGDEKFEARAEVLTGEERDELYHRQAASHPTFGEYEQRTTRVIPVVALYRK